MSERKDGGPAFPFKQRYGDDVRQQAAASGRPLPEFISNSGMSLRDYFAAAAMKGPVAHRCALYEAQELSRIGGISWMAKTAYAIADAMIAERDK